MAKPMSFRSLSGGMPPPRRGFTWLGVLGLVVPVLTLGLVLSGCVKSRQPGESQDGQSDQVVIGFSVATDTFILERWNKDIRIFTSTAKDMKARVIFQLSAGGTDAQIEQIGYLLTQDIDVLVVLPHDSRKLGPVIRQARDRGIPVIAYDRLILGVPIDGYVSFDNQGVGRLFGQALTEAVPRGRYLVVNGSVKDNNSFLVNRGLYEVLQPYIDRGDIQVIDQIWLDEWNADEASEKILEVLNRTQDIQAISAANDQLANAAINLLSQRRMAGRVAVVGQDADLLSTQRVVEGLQLMTVYKPIPKLASRAAELAVALAEGKEMEPDSWVENDTSISVPFYMEEPIAVYRWNMEETIIRDGFHSPRDVYRTRDQDSEPPDEPGNGGDAAAP